MEKNRVATASVIGRKSTPGTHIEKIGLAAPPPVGAPAVERALGFLWNRILSGHPLLSVVGHRAICFRSFTLSCSHFAMECAGKRIFANLKWGTRLGA